MRGSFDRELLLKTPVEFYAFNLLHKVVEFRLGGEGDSIEVCLQLSPPLLNEFHLLVSKPLLLGQPHASKLLIQSFQLGVPGTEAVITHNLAPKHMQLLLQLHLVFHMLSDGVSSDSEGEGGQAASVFSVRGGGVKGVDGESVFEGSFLVLEEGSEGEFGEGSGLGMSSVGGVHGEAGGKNVKTACLNNKLY